MYLMTGPEKQQEKDTVSMVRHYSLKQKNNEQLPNTKNRSPVERTTWRGAL
jgi:hypothetical protein